MSNYLLIIAIIAAQMGVFTLAWAVVGSLRLAPQLAGGAIACNAFLGTALALISARAWLPMWVGLVVANACVFFALVMMRRGISRFAGARTSWLEDLFILGLATFGLAVSLHDNQGSLRIVVTQLPAIYLLTHTAWIARRNLDAEFGAKAARLCATPIFVIAALQVVRFAGSLLDPARFVLRIDEATTANVFYTLSTMVGGLCINITVLTMVILRVVKRLDHLTRQDPMTGLLNRRAIEDALVHEVGRARRRSDTRLSLLAIDVDHFKRINDEHGHPVGDAALVALAQTLRESSRTGDLVARAGGEEFWVLLPNTDAEGALGLAERIREDVSARPHDADGRPLQVTVSIGVAVFEDRVETPQQLFARADKALYEAKAGGRNCCRLAGAPRVPMTPSGFGNSRTREAA
jgi:diguanylate cyclase (GGDEF)-like protein